MPPVDINGVRLRIETLPHRRSRPDRAATPIVFVHGLAAASGFWYAAGAQVLAGLGPCVFYDLRGHGKSAAPETGYTVSHMTDDLFGVMDAKGIESAHLVAHSFGGMIALLAALRQPERVKSLVLADARVRPLQSQIALPKVPPALVKRLEKLGIESRSLTGAPGGEGINYLRIVAQIQLTGNAEADQLLAALYQHPGLFRSSQHARKWVALAERASFVEDITHGKTFTKKDLEHLEQPMLILVGEKSPVRRSAETLKVLCPDTKLRVIPGAGHFFPLSRPRAFLRPTWQFLRRQNKSLSEKSGAL